MTLPSDEVSSQSVPVSDQRLFMPINKQRVTHELHKLATISDAKLPAVTRVLFTQKDLEARSYLISLFKEAGLTVRIDAVGNTFARWEGSSPDLPAIATGSHIDAIPESGQYDGTVGVIGALEAIRALKERGYTPRRSIELLIFTAEEPTRFGIGCIGSRMLEGSLSPQSAAMLQDENNDNFDAIRTNAGFSGDLNSVVLKENAYHSFIELHIEQGPILESEQLDIGVVSSIAAPSTVTISLEGDGGHAGAVLMHNRTDTSCAASEINLAIEHNAKNIGGTDTVATTGIFTNGPGAVNSIPRTSTLCVDVRDIKVSRRNAVLEAIKSDTHKICERRGVRYGWKVINKDDPADCSADLIQTLHQQAQKLEISSKTMISRAYHDCLFMAHVVPSVLLFIPCHKGYSHRPDEYSSPEQIEKGIQVLAATLEELSR